MIPFLIYMLVRKHGGQACAKVGIHIRKWAASRLGYLIVVFFVLLLAVLPLLSKSQNLRLKYKVEQGGDNIGWVNIERSINGSSLSIVLLSEISTRFIFMINVLTKESCTYENGKLQFSSVYRNANGSTKVDKRTTLKGDRYEVTDGAEKSILPITYISKNLLSLYFQEPSGVTQVYCDNHERFLAIVRTGDGAYKVDFPDGSSNSYYYQGGVCTRVKVNHNFYSVNIILIP